MRQPKPQRIRDPIHNLIEFGSDQFESTLWRVVQTRPFQRLRRIRQLGFSEFVFPGATHTRFSHSIGVFHTARQLMRVIKKYVDTQGQQYKEQQANHAIAAALLHDIGHGMFSHAFEAIGNEFNWPMAKHEKVSVELIRKGEIKELLDSEFGRGYADNVADIIAAESPGNLYGSVVSSQFDADRLDYMQRDRFMTGVQSSGVDPTWLLSNLEVAEIDTGVDDSSAGRVETLVLGPKAIQTAESYILSLFHLYPNLYLHKATRGAEKVFQALMRKIVHLHQEGMHQKTGLSKNHPILRFIEDPKIIDHALNLDDTVFWGALPSLNEAEDKEIQHLSSILHNRHLLKCIDIRQFVESEKTKLPEDRNIRQAIISKICEEIVNKIKEEQKKCSSIYVLIDQYKRHPYKRFQDSKTPLNQILIRSGNGSPMDIAAFSPVIAHAETFNVCRAYVFRDDKRSCEMIENIIRTEIRESKHDNT